MSAKLLIGIVPHGEGETLAGAARAAGAGGGTIVMGRGTAPNSLLAMLGFGDTSKDVTLTFVDGGAAAGVRDAMVAASAEKRRHFGVLFAVDALWFGRGRECAAPSGKDGIAAGGAEAGDMEAKNENPRGMRMIGLIVNKGYAEDAMAAARAAGAGGGTILNGRGTARPDDAKFFGVALVPEKEVLVILADGDKADAVLRSVRGLPCLAEKGSGIAFCLPVTDFAALGA